MKGFVKYLIVWISQNLAIPFWTVGHIHLMTSIYDDIIEILASSSMNIIVALGFWISWRDQKNSGNNR
jgi:hypothetical protein